METELTSEQANLFRITVLATAEKLGLKDWDIRIENYTDTSMTARQAEVHESISSRIANVRLNMVNYTNTRNYNVVNTAVHEVLHILLAEQWNFCRELINKIDPAYQEDYVSRLDGIQHAIINRLVPCLTN